MQAGPGRGEPPAPSANAFQSRDSSASPGHAPTDGQRSKGKRPTKDGRRKNTPPSEARSSAVEAADPVSASNLASANARAMQAAQSHAVRQGALLSRLSQQMLMLHWQPI